MKKLAVVIMCAALMWAAVPGVGAAPPPTIFRFESDVAAVTVSQLEAGDGIVTLAWHVAHVTGEHRLLLYVYREYEWVLINTSADAMPFVGSLPVKLEHPLNFGPVSYRLAVTDQSGRVWDERTLVIPYDTAALAEKTPTILAFTAGVQTLDAATIAAGDLRIEVAWEVADRLPLTNLVFEQMIGEQVQNVELPRDLLWIPSTGTGVVAPTAPPSGHTLELRLSVVDVITADVYAEKRVTITLIGTALPPAPGTVPTPTALPDTPSLAGDLTVLNDCTFNTSPVRGWVDGPGIPSPDTSHFVYATNPQGDAKLVIARADGSGQVEVQAPDKNLPIGIDPRWSPDSGRIAFANIAISQPGGGTIYVVKTDGTDLRRVAQYTGFYDDLAWSPDGSLLYFTSGNRQGAGSGTQVVGYTVFSVTADGLSMPQEIVEGCGVRQ